MTTHSPPRRLPPPARGSIVSLLRTVLLGTVLLRTVLLRTVLLGTVLLSCRDRVPVLPAYPSDPLPRALDPDAPSWQLVALEYAQSPHAPLAMLDSEAAPGATIAMSWSFFVAAGHGRLVLIDAGTDGFTTRRPPADSWRSVESWDVERARTVADALGAVGVSPEQVTDVVLTHHHWDHVEGLVSLPKARVHVHADEWPVLLESPLIDAPVRAALAGLGAQGRLSLFEGDQAKPWPGLKIRTWGTHTPHHSVVELVCRDGPVVIAGDAAYSYADLGEAAALQASGALLLGHDPELYRRWPSSRDGVARICPPR